MKSLLVFLVLALFAIAVQARHYTDKIETDKHKEDDLTQNADSGRDSRDGQMRHRRKRYNYNLNYGHDYPPPPYYIDRREYDRNQELMPQIWRLLDEISAFVRRPPPQPLPQVVYVPYPVPYPFAQKCQCNAQSTNVTAETRFPTLEDPNQNWGFTNTNQNEEDDGTDGSRPISLEPIRPQIVTERPQKEVDHGSEQETTTSNERTPNTLRGTKTCNAAILTCCNEEFMSDRKGCFTRIGCAMTFAKGNGCSKQSIAAAIEAFRREYSP